MPLKLPKDLPAIEAMKLENIFVMDAERAQSQEIRPLRICILNLMPVKETTENDLVRLLSNTPLQVELTFMMVPDHVSRHTPAAHMERFYTPFDRLRSEKFDGLIITGAPLEQLDYGQVTYWPALCEIFDWSRTHVQSTMYICWAAQAGLYHHYGVPKHALQKKMFGVFRHTSYDPHEPIFRGFDDEFYVPHSRHSEVRRADIDRCPELTVMSESRESGVYMVMARGGREIYVTGHSEYAPLTLDAEYKRDLAKGLPIDLPVGYYRDGDPNAGPLVRWRSTANLLFANWLNYYVYQSTPYCIEDID